MKVSVFGGSGFIGKQLVKELTARGHDVQILDIRKDPTWSTHVANSQAVVNLAGFPLFKKRWTMQVKSAIHDSRIEGTKAIVAAIGSAKAKGQGPEVFVSGSAVGFYGPDNDLEFTEKSSGGLDFLAFVCRDWEEAAVVAQNQYAVRTVLLRTGVVLGKNGGALEQLLPPFKAFAGGPVGSGKQWMSWIHIDDIVGIIVHSIENKNVHGPLNGASPNPVRNKDFAKALGHALGRPSVLPLPGFMLYCIVGEAAEILVNGQKVLPQATLASGYKFKYSDIDSALKSIV